MKIFFTMVFGLLFLATSAKKPDRISISTGKNAKIELRYRSRSKKSVPAVFIVTNAAGQMMSTQSSNLACGNNAVCLCEALDLPEGTYTVQMTTGNKVYKSQFIVWK